MITKLNLCLLSFIQKNSKCPIVVAVKTLKSESRENKVKFLQEAAIMGQFNHRNVVVMHGVVLTGKPVMCAWVLCMLLYSHSNVYNS